MIRNKILTWFDSIITPREELGGMAICPYAKLATLSKAYNIQDTTIENIHDDIQLCDVVKYKVCIFILTDWEVYDVDMLSSITKKLNEHFNSNDKVILDNDPRMPFVLNGVTTSFEHNYLWVVQSLSDLNQKSESLKNTNYYSFWTQEQLDDVVTWRTLKK